MHTLSPHPTIETVDDLSVLVRAGFQDWKSLGHVRTTTRGELILFNYTNKAQYMGRWNAFERMSRGLIVHQHTGHVVARPFEKFFNWNERGHTTHAAPTLITEKMDGSLGILYRDPSGTLCVATRGSFESPQALWAARYTHSHLHHAKIPEGWTLLVEIIAPLTRVIVNYQGREDLVLLAARNNRDGTELSYNDLRILADDTGLSLVAAHPVSSLETLISTVRAMSSAREGFVVRFEDGQRFKFKSPQYLDVARKLAGLSKGRVVRYMRAGEWDQVRISIPEELRDEADTYDREIRAHIASRVDEVHDVLRSGYPQKRAAFAQWAKEHHRALMPYLFGFLDGRDLHAMALSLEFKSTDATD